jgi:hypothetical protein
MPEIPKFPFNNPKLSKEEALKLWNLNNPSQPSADEFLRHIGVERVQKPVTEKSAEKTRG